MAFLKGTNLGGTSANVIIAGKKAAVFSFAASQTNLQLQVPVDAPVGPTTVTVGSSTPFNITLTQYCPGIAINNNIAAAFHFPSGTPVTTANPAIPNEQIGLVVTGLGPTNPVFATGTAPDDDQQIPTVTKPAATIAGKALTVTGAFLQTNNPGFYYVLTTMPSDLTTGNQTVVISIGGLNSNSAPLPFSTAPVISQVTNAASYISVGPSRQIAQGSIVVIKGVQMGPADISIASEAFKSTTLGGTSVKITSGPTSVDALMYYTSATQIAALVPSNTPLGNAQVTVTYNGQTSANFGITVVASNPAIFTVTSDGAGAGIITYPDYSLVSTTKAANCGGVYTTCGAANPGDVLIIWATGLGPIIGSDAAGDGLGVNQTSVPLTILVGNVPVTATYQGRSGCCIGEDQLVFTVPPDAPLGCAVPVMLTAQQPGGLSLSSNTVSVAIAASGSRTCTPSNFGYTTSIVTQSTGPGPFTIADVELSRTDTAKSGNTGLRDDGGAFFGRITFPEKIRPFVFSYVDVPALGTCRVDPTTSFDDPDPPLEALIPLNVGPQLTIQNANGTKTAPPDGEGGYGTTLSFSANFLTPGAITVSAPGGPDSAAFSTTITIPQMPVMTSPPPDAATAFTVTRSAGLTVNWTGGSPGVYIVISGIAPTDNTGQVGMSFHCVAPSAPGTFIIPSAILGLLPPSNFGGLLFSPTATPVPLAGSAFQFSSMTVHYESYTPLKFQ